MSNKIKVCPRCFRILEDLRNKLCKRCAAEEKGKKK